MPAYRLLSNLILILHVGIVLFIVGGLALFWIGRWRRWSWVRHGWLRLIHLALMGVVAAEALIGWQCPLTDWEAQLRERAGESSDLEPGFIAYWLHRLLFFDFPPWFFTLIYVLFFLLVLWTVRAVPPRWPWRRNE
jgi:hypothetical protein